MMEGNATQWPITFNVLKWICPSIRVAHIGDQFRKTILPQVMA